MPGPLFNRKRISLNIDCVCPSAHPGCGMNSISDILLLNLTKKIFLEQSNYIYVIKGQYIHLKIADFYIRSLSHNKIIRFFPSNYIKPAQNKLNFTVRFCNPARIPYTQYNLTQPSQKKQLTAAPENFLFYSQSIFKI